jgi:hypothetical protein
VKFQKKGQLPFSPLQTPSINHAHPPQHIQTTTATTTTMSSLTPAESEYVTLESSDGFQFVIHREVAMLSGTVKNMLSSPGKQPSFLCNSTMKERGVLVA